MGLLTNLFKKGNKIEPEQKLSFEPEQEMKAIRLKRTKENIASALDNFIVLDTETTGIKRKTDHIIEIGAVHFYKGREIGSYQSLIKSVPHVPSEATRVNHITDELIAKDGKELCVVWSEVVKFIGNAIHGDTVILAYNADFDMEFIVDELFRQGYKGTLRYMDVLQMTRSTMRLPNYKQTTICECMGIETGNQHRAKDDAKACGEIFLRLARTCSLTDSYSDERIIKPLIIQKAAIEQRNIPTDEELETAAVIRNILKQRGVDVSGMGFYRNSNQYVDVIDGYTLLKYKQSSSNYILIDRSAGELGEYNCANASKSEGDNYRRLCYKYSLDLYEYADIIVSAYRIAQTNKVSDKDYMSHSYHSLHESYEITDTEAEALLRSAAERKDMSIKREMEAVACLEREKIERERKKKEREACLATDKKERESLPDLNVFGMASDETIRLIREIQRRSAETNKRAVVMLNDEGQVLQVFESVTAAAAAVSCDSKTMRDACNGKQKHARGYVWRYADAFL